MKFEVIFQCSASLVVGLEAEPREGCGVAVVVRVALDLTGVVASGEDVEAVLACLRVGPRVQHLVARLLALLCRSALCDILETFCFIFLR